MTRPRPLPTSPRLQRRLRGFRPGTVMILRRPEELARLRRGWRALDTDVPGPSSELDWVRGYAELLPEDEQLFVVAIRDEHRLTGVAPLVRLSGPLPRLRLTDDAGGFRFASEDELKRLADAVLDLRLPLSLSPLLAGGATSRLVKRRARARRRVVVERDGWVAPSLELGPDDADPLTRLPGRRRRRLRQLERIAARVGEERFEVHDASEFERWFDALIELESRGWKGHAGSALADDPDQQRQYRDFLCAPDVRPNVRFATLHLGERLAAIDVAVVLSSRFWGLKGAFDESLRHCSPGILLKVRLIGWAARAGLERFEFMGESEPWKEVWAPPQQVANLRIYPPSPVGAAALCADGTSKALQELAARRSRSSAGTGPGSGEPPR